MRNIRVRHENAEVIVAALRAAGYQAEYLGQGTATTSLWGGCNDPNHCEQHEARYAPARWGSVRTNTSGMRAHFIIEDLNLWR